MILRLLSYNIRYGGTGREESIAACIAAASPDMVVFQEATSTRVIETLAGMTGLRHWGARPGYSLGFISRLPVASKWQRPRLSRHAFLELIPEGTDWRVFGVHLSAVHAAWTERRRVYELRALLTSIGQEQPGPHALVGDFNTLAPGELLEVAKLPARLRALVWLSGGSIRWRTIQTVLDAGYVDAFRQHHPDLVGNTFPTWDPHVRLDYLFVPGGFIANVRTCEVLTPSQAAAASDHFPFFAELDV